MVAASLVRSGRRSLLLRRLALGVLVAACFATVRQTQAQYSAADYCNRGNAWYAKQEFDLAITDGTFSAGMAGVGSGWNNAMYDNFSVQPISGLRRIRL